MTKYCGLVAKVATMFSLVTIFSLKSLNGALQSGTEQTPGKVTARVVVILFKQSQIKWTYSETGPSIYKNTESNYLQIFSKATHSP